MRPCTPAVADCRAPVLSLRQSVPRTAARAIECPHFPRGGDAMRRTLAALTAVILLAACTASTTPAPSTAGATSAGQSSSSPAATRRGHHCRRRELRPVDDHGQRGPVGMAVLTRRGQCPHPDPARLPGRLSEHQGGLPAARWRLCRRHGREVRVEGRPGRLLRRRGLRRAVDRPGLPGAARRLHRQVGLRHQPVLRRLCVDLQGRRRQGLRPAQGRQHDRHGLQHRPRPDASQDDGRAHHPRPVAQGQGRAQGADLPELRPRPRARVPVRAGRLAPVRRRQDGGRSTAMPRRRPSSGTWTSSRTASA